jgi:hypothetical protein
MVNGKRRRLKDFEVPKDWNWKANTKTRRTANVTALERSIQLAEFTPLIV